MKYLVGILLVIGVVLEHCDMLYASARLGRGFDRRSWERERDGGSDV